MTGENNNSLENAEVLLCVTGGIACYKSADLASKLSRSGAGVTVAMTDAAGRFITPLTFGTLTGREVYTSLWQEGENYQPQHLSLTERADLMIVAPATADIIAKMTVGIADDLVSALALSAWEACEILIAPAMNTRMWLAHPTRDNVQKLTERGVHIIGPNEGRLACGTTGIGRMAEPDEILAAAEMLLKKS